MILEARKSLSLTQERLARMVGVKASFIAFIEAGRRKPSISVLMRIADAIGLDGWKLLAAAYPETQATVKPIAGPKSATEAWRELLNDRELLIQYGVTPRELNALKQLSLLGYVLSTREFLAILMLIRGDQGHKTRKRLKIRTQDSS